MVKISNKFQNTSVIVLQVSSETRRSRLVANTISGFKTSDQSFGSQSAKVSARS